jgi:hypothetical protein
VKGKNKKVIRPWAEIMNDNPKCHLHIPQFRKDIYVLNIIKASKKKKDAKEKYLKGTPKTLMPPMGVQKPDESKNLENNPERNQITHLQG